MAADRRNLIPASVMVFTLDEEVNLPACLESIAGFDDVIVVDSFSTDRTEQIAREHGARFCQNRFEGFGTQRNWALDNAQPRHQWVLMLDADERVTEALAEEMREVIAQSDSSVGAYRIRRRFHLWGRWLRYSSLYPTWVVRLIRTDRVRYRDRGHAETEEVAGEVKPLCHDLIDENLKGIGEWFERQNRYAAKESMLEVQSELGSTRFRGFFSSDPLRRREAMKALGRALPGRPLWFFLYSFIIKGGWRDGVDGYQFCLMKTAYQIMLEAHKHDRRLASSKDIQIPPERTHTTEGKTMSSNRGSRRS